MKKTASSIKGGSGNLSWYFPSTNHGREDGFADSGIENFVGDYKKYIARETIQNAVDQRIDSSQPVRVVFEQLMVPVSNLPGHEMLLDCMDCCLKFIPGQEKAEAFFKSAIGLLKGKKMAVLKISDFNTAGLSGSDNDREGNWHRLVRVTGTSSPKGVAGGSFGIGKGAPFAGSLIRTVFYSSINDKNQPVFQGVARLVSHMGEDKDVHQGVGFFGVEGYKAIRNEKMIPNLFRRKERGTDIFIMGFKTDEEWKVGLIRSVLDNFWLSILHGDLEVIIKDGPSIEITKDTLRDILQEYDASNALCYFEAITNPTQPFHADLKHLGKVSLFVRKQDNYPSKVMKVRKPKMFVQADRYTVLREPYAAVFICENDQGNRLLRDLEPPAHDEWIKERIEGGQGFAALRELDQFVKDSLRGLGETVTSEPEDIAGLSQYLPDSEDREAAMQGKGLEPSDKSGKEETGRQVGATQDPASSPMDNPIRRSSVVRSPADVGDEPGGIRGGRGGTGGGKKKGGDEGKHGKGDDGDRINTADIFFRSFMQKAGDEVEYHFVIKTKENCEGSIRLIAIGDDNDYPAEIKSAVNTASKKAYQVDGSLIKGLSLKKGETVRLVAKLLSAKKYVLGIENHER